MNAGSSGSEPSDTEVLRSACAESREVLDDQLAELSDIGDKALWTVRTSMIVLGIVASVASLGSTDTLGRLQGWILVVGLVGVVLLLTASVWGLGTYFVSDRVRGISPGYRSRTKNAGLDKRDWYRALLHGYDQWIAEMESMTDRYGSHLFKAQLLFLIGVSLVVAAAVLSVWTL